MALGYGDLTFSQVRAEFSGPPNLSAYRRGAGYVPDTARNAGVSAGIAGLRLSQFRGTSYATTGSGNWASPGYYEWALPPCEWITFTILGAGGGGGGSTIDGGYPGGNGTAGGTSAISFGPCPPSAPMAQI